MSSALPKDTPYWAALNRCLKLGPTRFAQIRQAFDDMQTAWEAPADELAHKGLEPALVQALLEHRPKTDVQASWAEIERLGLAVITLADDGYPKALAQIYDPPPVLYVKGNAAALSQDSLAVVGTRRATSYGLRVTETLIPDLAVSGLVIVSGLAYGIDAAAHRACLAAGGTTVAVLACGLDRIYPPAHQPLAEDIVRSGGALVTEFAPGVPPLKQHFPFRNRIIAGLAKGALIIEAAEGSGALLTAQHALEANREVFAVPGNISSQASWGPNELIRQGAHPVWSGRHILDAFGLEAASRPRASRTELSPEQAGLLSRLTHEPIHIDDLIRESGIEAAELAPMLTVLELGGYAKEVEPQTYIRLV